MSDNTEGNEHGGENTGSGAAWSSSVPENLRDNEAFKGIEKSSDAWQQFVDMKGRMESSVQIPGENATDEDRAAFYTKLGRPETADKYTITKPDTLPEGVQYSEDTEAIFKTAFHEVGLSDQAAQKLWGKYHEVVAQGYETQQKAEQAAHEAAINELKNDWTGDNFKVNTEIAHRAFTGIFKDETKQEEAKKFIEETKINGLPLGDHPMFLKMFHKIGSVIGDDTINHGRGGLDSGMTDEEKAKLRFPNTKFK